MLDLLHTRYSRTYQVGTGLVEQYVRAEHVRSSLGYESRRTLDFVAVDLTLGYGPAETRGPHYHGHEIKVSRADWLTELRDPEKAETFSRWMQYFWLVVPDRSIVQPGELPDGWGLLVKYGRGLRAVVPAPRRTVPQMPSGMAGALLRASVKTARRRAGLHPVTGQRLSG